MKIARGGLSLLAALWLGLCAPSAHAEAATPTEQQLKAVFVFNFSHFVAWPPDAFGTPTEPFLICVLGGDALGEQLKLAVRDERLDTHPLEVRALHDAEDIRGCKILYIDGSAGAAIDRVLARVAHERILTVSDADDAARRGVIIQLDTEDNRIHLLINTDSARAAGLTISSNLLRLARVAHTGD